jgi:glycosyltransferase involved in cell wall biosynthesis
MAGNAASNVSVVIAALNEAGSVGGVVEAMPWGEIAECIVVDNGSTDATGEVAAAAGARVIASPRGYGAAMHAGACAAVSSSTVLVFLDGDGADPVEEMARLVEPIERGEADFVLASRILGTREAGSMNATQVFAGYLIGWMVRVLYGRRYTDMCAFRAIRREALDAMQMREMTFGWNLEMQIKAVTMGLRVIEVPVNYRNRVAGESKVSGSLVASVKAAWRIFGVFVRVRKQCAVSRKQ